MKGKSKPLNVTDLGHALFTEGSDAHFVYEPESSCILEVNPATSRVTGYTREELLEKRADFLLRFSDTNCEERLQKATQATTLFLAQEGYFLRTKQDGWIPVNLTISRLHLQQGTLCLVMARDVREQHKAHLRLQAVEAELRRVLTSVSDCLWSAVIDSEGQWTYRYISPVIEKITGQPSIFFAEGPRQWLHVVHPEDRQRWRTMQERLRNGESLQEEFRIVRPDSAQRWVRNSVVISREPNTHYLKLGGVLTDITERKEAEENVRRSTAELHRVMASVSDYVWSGEVDSDGRFCYHYYSPVVEKVTGRPPKFFMESPDRWLSIIHAEDRIRLARSFTRIRCGQSTHEEEEYRIVLPDGSIRWVRDSATATRLEEPQLEAVTMTDIDIDGSGTTEEQKRVRLRIDGVVGDITERKQAEAALRASEEHYRALFECNPQPMWIYDAENRGFLAVNDAAVAQYGYSREEFLHMTIDDIEPQHEISRLSGIATIHKGLQNQQGNRKHRRKNGSVVEVELTSRPWRYQGRDARLVLANDITERRSLEAQLRQAQKMEAVGRLAGGIAHDFNNLLTIILGFSEMALESLTSEQSAHGLLEEIHKSGQRAATLTGQLLAFSRKQLLQPVVLRINDVMVQIERMLRRLIGEDIELVTHVATDVYPVKADAGQLEQVIMNLAVNSRDAMPHGGKLIITAMNVELGEQFRLVRPEVHQGSYVQITVRDTGTGMSAETLAHIFEPFFTTKGVGKGTGLGLATVYGIIKQSGGYIYVDSTLGRGTAFQIYLPRVMEVTVPAIEESEPLSSLHGTETVLLVEDENPVRQLSRQILQQHGYTVVDAPNGKAALELAEQHTGNLDLLITDVIMPGINGRELATSLCKSRPALKVLYISGYPDELLGRQGTLDPSTALLPKPFTPEMLARKVREVLQPDSDLVSGEVRCKSLTVPV